jgi:NTE family protein
MVVSDTASQDMRVLNHRTAPDVPVANVVRMTMSIPFVWQEVIWQESWGSYLGQSLKDHVFVDGGLLSNFPLEYLTDNTPDVTAVMGTPPTEEAGIIGFLVDETLEVPNAPAPAATDDSHYESRVLNRVRKLVDTMTGAHDKRVMAAHADKVCRLPAKGYGTTEFDMTPERREALVAAGRAAMKKFLETID